MRKALLSFGLFFILFGLTGSGEAVVDRVVAIVNQEIITLSEVEKGMTLLQEEMETGDRLERQKQIREHRGKVLEKLIEERLIDQEAKRLEIKVTSKEVETALEEIKRRNSATQEDIEKALEKEGITFEAYKKQIEKTIQGIKLVSWAVKVEPKVGEKELSNFYEKHIDQYRSQQTYRPAHILFIVPKETRPEEIQEIRKKCQSVLNKIRSGEDFGEMALLYSEDASSKDRGDMGYFKKGELLPAFEKEALRLRPGEVGGIVRTNFGFHIIKLLDIRGGTPAPFEEIKEKVRMDYFEREREKAFKQFLSTLKEKAVIEIKL